MATIVRPRQKGPVKPQVEVLFSAKQIASRVEALAQEISADYKGRNLLLIGVLKGSFMFLGDMIRHLAVPVEIDFLSVSSYAGDTSTGMVKLNFDFKTDARGRDVLLIDDIVDTGFSLAFARKHILERKARSVEVGVLLDKPQRRKVLVPVRYTGFTVPDRFVVGYGLDYNERYRELPYIGVLPLEKIGP
ncbi:MAG: hypoxanthine phosphoribosyltransferase [Elusimicrobia bacterium]|nr:hypoxanthine phosphoribosyltransferase [Elusimicrobiota bacterium]